ncbi:cysteine desulfurase family protein [Namhaeicola litoreus]|uniref:cysteine desulfurase n=1 Tax=Namhaeicola litoreus TaxID=1052145 RepID=A0ABW3Y4P7_9FLAO
MQSIYLDNAATTPLKKEVVDIMTETHMNNFGNPSSTHQYGRKAKALLESARKNIAKYLHCDPSEIYFTGGGTEADNLILFNSVRNLGVKRIITSLIEHHAVLHTIDRLVFSDHIEVCYVKLLEDGSPNLQDLENLLTDGKPTLVSLMWVNNEIGNTIDLKQLALLCKKYGAYFHSDTVQGIGHLPLNLKETGVHFIAASAHKFHGPKGVGFAYIQKGIPIQAHLIGGEQERAVRAGTENLPGILGMEKALQLATENLESDMFKLKELKSYFIEELRNNFKNIQFNGTSAAIDISAPHILNVRFPKSIPMLLFQLDLKGIAASGGSACQSGSNKGSHVLQNVLNEQEQKKTSVRFSFSTLNTKEEIDCLIMILKELIKD